MEDQRTLDIEAYTAVVKAFHAGGPDWEKEEVLTKLRIILGIDNEFHMNLMTSIREGRALPRPARTAARPSASLGGAGTGRRPGAAGHSEGGSGLIDSDEDYSDELSRQRRKQQQQRKDARGSGLAGGAAVRRQPSARPSGGGGGLARTGSGAARPPAARARSSRPRDGRYAISEDPFGYVGRRVWRYWLSENPPWVEGYVSLYNPESGDWTIVYDPNTNNETMEEGFNFNEAGEGVDYVMAEYVDISTMIGSRRQAEKPVVSAAALAAPPPFLAQQAPSKKRKQSMVPVPADAPFDNSYFASRVPVAAEEELQQMLVVLERKERAVEAELQELENMEADSTLLEQRAGLERKFAELCDREDDILQELARLKAMEA